MGARRTAPEALTPAVANVSDSPVTRYAAHALPLLAAPFAPHLAEDLWERFGHAGSVHLERFLEPDERALSVETLTLVVQVNGKVRARLNVAPGIAEERAVELAMAEPNVRAQLDELVTIAAINRRRTSPEVTRSPARSQQRLANRHGAAQCLIDHFAMRVHPGVYPQLGEFRGIHAEWIV